jgi:anti-sigma factor RsiW
VTSRFETAEAFAYVDNCLGAADRRAFEARLREDADLRRQVALWESQNGAIRAAYGAAASARAAIDLGGNSNENFPVWMASAIQTRRSAAATRANGEARSKAPRAESATVPRTPSPVPPAPRFALGRRVLAIAAIAAGLIVVGAPGGPTWPRGQSIEAGLAAYRAFAAASDVPVEFRTSDPETLTKWLTPQFARGIVVPRFSSDALTLLGGRIAPGTTTSAAFLVYEDRRGERVGLLIEPLDAPAPTTPSLRESDGLSLAAWTDAGHGFVAAGRNPEDVVMLRRLVEESPAPPR